MPLDPATLAAGRAVHTGEMLSTVVIKSKASSTRDAEGNYVAGASVDKTVKGTIGEMTGREVEMLGLAVERRYFHLHLPAGTAVDGNATLTVDGVGYQVAKVLSPNGPQEMTTHVIVYRG